MKFYVGQKVECIFELSLNVPEEKEHGVALPVLGGIYTVRSVDRRICYTGTADCIQLVEIINPELGYWDGSVFCETAFDAEAFRPLTDISVFNDALASRCVASDETADAA